MQHNQHNDSQLFGATKADTDAPDNPPLNEEGQAGSPEKATASKATAAHVSVGGGQEVPCRQTSPSETSLQPIDVDGEQDAPESLPTATVRPNAVVQFWGKAKSLQQPLLLWIGTTVLGIVYCIAVYHVLLWADPQIGAIHLTATSTNYAVAVFSQAFSMLTDMMVKAALDSLRWELAARRRGVSFPTFFQLSGATDLVAELIFTAASRLENWWGILR
jgi:hypothetical protein